VVILLDIDGVMVPCNSWKAPIILSDGFYQFTKKSVECLNILILRYDANIILTTSHKYKYTLEEWKSIFISRGIAVNSIDRLEENITNINRKNEILNWEISDDFIIIDDDKSLNDLPSSYKSNLILTDSGIGLVKECIKNLL
jgi:hypothetical protein